jgi:flagellar hook-basal body complex protein FliE
VSAPIVGAALAVQGGAAVQGAPAAGAAGGPSFGEMVRDGLAQVDRQLQASQADLQQLAVGNVESLHEVMIRMEESRLSFQLMLQVRNRLLEAYQDVMRTQV